MAGMSSPTVLEVCSSSSLLTSMAQAALEISGRERLWGVERQPYWLERPFSNLKSTSSLQLGV